MLGAQAKQDASAISSNYVGPVQLLIRQAFGAMEFTVSKDDSSCNVDDILVFMKGSESVRKVFLFALTPCLHRDL